MKEKERETEGFSDKASGLGSNGYINRGDGRRRQKERLLDAPAIESNNFRGFKVHEKDNKVQFRVSPFALKVGSEVAALFNMTLHQYAKAVLYHDLGLVFEPIDRRKKVH